MIKDKVISFGYGDIAVASNSFTGGIYFTNIKPPMECGAMITSEDMDGIEFGLCVTIYDKVPHDFYHLVRKVTSENPVFEYDGYTIDFSNYNEKSYKVVRDAAFKMVNTLTLAC